VPGCLTENLYLGSLEKGQKVIIEDGVAKLPGPHQHLPEAWLQLTAW
jgi:hypothetical protein